MAKIRHDGLMPLLILTIITSFFYHNPNTCNSKSKQYSLNAHNWYIINVETLKMLNFVFNHFAEMDL